MNELRNVLADLVRRDLKVLAPGSQAAKIPRDALAEFAVGALLSILTWWMDAKGNLAPAEADAIFRRLAIPAIFEQ